MTIPISVQSYHYYKTRLLQLGFPTHGSEKTRTLLTWKTTSRFGQEVKCGHSNVGHHVPNGHIPNGSEVWGAPRASLHKVMSYFTMPRQYKQHNTRHHITLSSNLGQVM